MGTRKAFIYKDGSLIKDIKLSNIAQRVYNKDHHFYIVTKNSIYWINTFDSNNITYGVIFQPIEEQVETADSTTQTEDCELYEMMGERFSQELEFYKQMNIKKR